MKVNSSTEKLLQMLSYFMTIQLHEERKLLSGKVAVITDGPAAIPRPIMIMIMIMIKFWCR